MHQYYIVFKPYMVLSQFSSELNKQTLQHFFKVPTNVYPVGRLDYDSEGLLLLTNDGSINKQLLHPSAKHVKTYWVQVDGAITPTAIQQLQNGVSITIDGKKYTTKKCVAMLINPNNLPERNPPIRYRKNIPTSWISLQLTEGKNRQVRKMTAAVGFPTLRLIRYSLEELTIENMKPGDIIELEQSHVYKALHL